MGHYAGEMGWYNHTPPTLEELVEREESRKSHVVHVWELYKKRREQGDLWGHKAIPCPECRAPIEFDDQIAHERWHNWLKSMSLIGPGLF